MKKRLQHAKSMDAILYKFPVLSYVKFSGEQNHRACKKDFVIYMNVADNILCTSGLGMMIK